MYGHGRYEKVKASPQIQVGEKPRVDKLLLPIMHSIMYILTDSRFV